MKIIKLVSDNGTKYIQRLMQLQRNLNQLISQWQGCCHHCLMTKTMYGLMVYQKHQIKTIPIMLPYFPDQSEYTIL